MRSLRLTLASAALALVVLDPAAAQAPAAYRVPAAAPANIKRAVESPARPADQRARDADRKPAETLMLAEIAEGERVVELAAFGHYWTNMLVEAVGSSGQVTMVDMPWTDRFGGEAGARVRRRARERDLHAGALQPDAAADERRCRDHGAVLSRPARRDEASTRRT